MEESVCCEISPTSSTAKLYKSDKDTIAEESVLDQYLYDLYQSELKFQIDETEVKSIKASVENLVERIVARSLACEIYTKQANLNRPLEFLKILKVGSFYEDTRNKFPDEFDYVAILSCSYDRSLWGMDYSRCVNAKLESFHKALHHTVVSGSQELTDGKLKLRRIIKISGPATKLEFVYRHGQNDEHLIQVDLSPAVQLEINKSNIKVLPTCLNNKWQKRVLKTGHYFEMLVFSKSSLPSRTQSIVETELDFITQEVSFHHKIAYRVLKHILSAHNEELRDIIYQQNCIYPSNRFYNFSSYHTKTLLYQHLDTCSSNNSVGNCCIDMLAIILNSFQTSTTEPYLTSILGSKMVLCNDKKIKKKCEKILKDSITKMQSLQNCQDKFQHKPHLCHMSTKMKPRLQWRVREKSFTFVGTSFILFPLFILSVIALSVYGVVIMIQTFTGHNSRMDTFQG